MLATLAVAIKGKTREAYVRRLDLTPLRDDTSIARDRKGVVERAEVAAARFFRPMAKTALSGSSAASAIGPDGLMVRV